MTRRVAARAARAATSRTWPCRVRRAPGTTAPRPPNSAAWGDIDNDGDLDLYVTTLGGSRYYLFVNGGSGHFAEEARERGAAVDTGFAHRGMSVTFGDYDRDGWLDIHTTEWRSPTA